MTVDRPPQLHPAQILRIFRELRTAMSDLLILEWSRDRLSALTVTEGVRSTVKATASQPSIDHADPHVPVANAGESLRAWLIKAGIAVDRAIIVVPREAVVLRRLQLPQAPPDELPELVRFQAATRTSAPIDTLVLDYLPLPAIDPALGQKVISCTMERDVLQRIQAVCQAAKIEVQSVRISSLTVAELVRTVKALDLGAEQPDLVVSQQGQRVELSIFDAGTLVFSHSTQLPEAADETAGADRLKPLKGDLSRCLVTLSQTHPNAGIARCYYVAGEIDTAVNELLQQRFPGAVTHVDSTSLQTGKSAAGYESLMGAALPARDTRLQLDLLHPRQRKEIPDRRKLYYGAGGAVALIAIMLAYMVFYSKKSGLEASIQALQTDVNTKTEQLKKAKPQADAHLRLANWQAGDADPIQLWNQLRTHLSATDRVYFTEMRISPLTGDVQARFIGRGHARMQRDVDELNQKLSDQGFRVRPTTSSPGSRDPDYPWDFDLDVELPRPRTTSTPPVVTTPVAKASAQK